MKPNILVGELPAHQYVFVNTEYTHKTPIGFIPAVWYGLVSYPGRVWGCTVMLESGAIYRNLPPNAIAFSEEPEGDWEAKDAQTWDCYGLGFTVLEYSYLSGLECLVMANQREHAGEYLFTVAPVGDAFSAAPDQAKEFMFIRLNSGWMTIQPTNHLVFRERSFTDKEMKFPSGLKCQREVVSVE